MSSHGPAMPRHSAPRHPTLRWAPRPFAVGLLLCCLLGTGLAETKNIYGETLGICEGAGSTADGQHCDEKGGGVHSLCVTELPGDFSSSTGQGPWTQAHKGEHWCVCIGAWSNYVAQDKPIQAQCNAIPDFVLGQEYIGNWNTWNSVSLPDQVVAGVNKLFEQCKAGQSGAKLEFLTQRYCTLAKGYTQFEPTDLFQAAGCANRDAVASSPRDCASESGLAQSAIDELKHAVETQPVVLYGWSQCPCTNIARTRFQELGVCFVENVWADFGDKTMKYLACEHGDEHHSFIWFGGDFYGDGFALEERKLGKAELQAKLDGADAQYTCQNSTSTGALDGSIRAATRQLRGASAGGDPLQPTEAALDLP